MTWFWISVWALGASLLVFAFAMGVSLRRFGAAIAMFIVAVLLIGGAVVEGGAINARAHGTVHQITQSY